MDVVYKRTCMSWKNVNVINSTSQGLFVNIMPNLGLDLVLLYDVFPQKNVSRNDNLTAASFWLQWRQGGCWLRQVSLARACKCDGWLLTLDLWHRNNENWGERRGIKHNYMQLLDSDRSFSVFFALISHQRGLHSASPLSWKSSMSQMSYCCY